MIITAIIVTAIVAGALGYGLRPDRHDRTIVHRPYNDRRNDASGARDFGLLD